MEFLLECVGFPPDTDFVALARRIEREFNLAEQAGAQTAEIQTLRIGLLTSIAGAPVAAAVAACPAEARGRVEFIPGSERELLGRLDAERIDVALTLGARVPVVLGAGIIALVLGLGGMIGGVALALKAGSSPPARSASQTSAG